MHQMLPCRHDKPVSSSIFRIRKFGPKLLTDSKYESGSERTDFDGTRQSQAMKARSLLVFGELGDFFCGRGPGHSIGTSHAICICDEANAAQRNAAQGQGMTPAHDPVQVTPQLIAYYAYSTRARGHLLEDQYWNRRVGQYMLGFATQQQAFDAFATMRGHHNQVALVFFCRCQ